MNSLFNTKIVGFSDIAICGNDAWVCNMYFSGLFHINLDTLEITFIAELPASDACGREQYGPIEYYEGKLIIAPLRNPYVLIYDIEAKSFQKIDIREYVETSYFNLFQKIIIWNDRAYLVPGRSHNIVCIDLIEYSITTIGQWYDFLQEDMIDTGRWLISDAFLWNDKLYLSSWQSGKVMCCDLCSGVNTCIRVNGCNSISSCSVKDDVIFATDRDYNKVAIINGNEQKIVCVKGPESFNSERGIMKVFPGNDRFLIIPYKTNMLLESSLNFEEQYEKLILPMEYAKDIPVSYPDNMRCCKQSKDGNIICYSLFDGEIIVLDDSFNVIKRKKAEINSIDRKNIIENYSGKYYSDIVIEKTKSDLEKYMEFIIER